MANETPSCPLAQGEYLLCTERCAWWAGDRCVVMTMTELLFAIYKELSQIKEKLGR